MVLEPVWFVRSVENVYLLGLANFNRRFCGTSFPYARVLLLFVLRCAHRHGVQQKFVLGFLLVALITFLLPDGDG
jgi:hypothetical protein